MVGESANAELQPHQRRICLVVDNPARDLEGLVLTAWHLARRGADPVLVPMYEQGFEVLGIGPDVVAVNYARTTNRFLLEAYAAAGIRISVLDTEGGVVDSLEDYATSLSRNGTAPYVDQVLAWGPLQYAAFRAYSGLEPDKIVLTGCPRMDFCRPPWRNALPDPTGPRPIILINTNFSLVNPRFNRSIERELAVTLEAGFSGWSDRYIAELAAETQAAFLRMIETAREVAQRLPQLSFVLRPHPFEDVAPYEAALANVPNLRVRLEGSVMTWLARSSAMLHLNCGTAVEAGLMEVPALSLEWFNTPALIQNAPLPREISERVNSMAQLIEILSRAEAGKLWALQGRDPRVMHKRIHEWFHNEDGRAAERAADALLSLAASRPGEPSPRWSRALAFIGGKHHRPVVGALDGAGRVLLGSTFRRLRMTLLTTASAGASRRAKAFDIADVASIVGRINRAAGLPAQIAVEALQVSRFESLVPGLGGSCVRLTARRGAHTRGQFVSVKED